MRSPAQLLHNMSVPPRSTITVRRASLPGERFLVDGRCLEGADWPSVGDEDAAAVLETLRPHTRLKRFKGRGSAWPTDPVQLFDCWMRWALAREEVPDRVGVFVSEGIDESDASPLPVDAVVAVLARRSGPLYLPRRPFTPSLLVPARLVLVFPEL